MNGEAKTSLDGTPLEQPVASPPPPEAPKKENETASVLFEQVVRPLAIATMLTCIAISFSQMIAVFSPDWPATYATILTFVVSLESIQAYRLLHHKHIFSRDRARFRFVEWVMILIAVRFGIYLRLGWRQLVADIGLWSSEIGTFFEGTFLALGFVMFIVWGLAYLLAEATVGLETDPLEKAPSATDPHYDLWVSMPHRGRVNRQAHVATITGIFFWGGVALLIFAGFAIVDIDELLTLETSRNSGVILNALVYFVLAFLLISHARFSVLKATWEIQSIPVIGRIDKRWLSMVIIFLLLVAVISALLPVGYSVGIIKSISTAIAWTAWFVTRVFGMIVYAIAYLFSLIAGLFGGSEAPPAPPPAMTPMPAPLPVLEEGVRAPSAWWQLIKSLLFWLLLTGVVGYSIYHFLGTRFGFLKRISLSRFWRWIQKALAGAGRAAGRAAQAIRDTLAQVMATRQGRLARRSWRYLGIRRLSPRDRLRYFYLSILRRGATQELHRPPSATPYEFEHRLAEAMPELAEEVHDLTQAFVEARYSAHEFDSSDISPVKEVWRRIKRWFTQHRASARRAAAPTSNDQER